MIFYFLWGDPVFSAPLETLPQEVTPEAIERRRHFVLTILNTYAEVNLRWQEMEESLAAAQERLAWMKERIAMLQWEVLELQKRVPPEVALNIQAETQVNALDPDFSFMAALEEIVKSWELE